MNKIVGISICMLVFFTTVSSVTVTGIINKKNTTSQFYDPEIEWVYTFDSIINDKAYYVDQTMDGGYIFTGSTVVTPPGYTELLLAKTDANGEESWHKNFPMEEINLYGTVVHQTTDGGYIIVGSIGGSWLWDVQVIKADSNGDLVWQKSFGKSDGPNHGSDILQTSDGGYIVLGSTFSYSHGSADLWLIKLAADGTEQWNKTVGEDTFDYVNKFSEADDGGYVIVGQTDATDDAGDIWVVKTSDTGEVSWQKTFGDANLTEDAVDIITESNGYTILVNFMDMNWTESLWLLHLDAQGTLTSDQHIYEDGTLHGASITKTKDGGYFITGTISDMSNYVPDVYLLKLNSQGATQWVKTIDISNGLSDEANWGIQTLDGGYVVVGNTGDLNNWTSDTFILKIAGEKSVVLESVTGGFGVQAHVKNLGIAEVTDVNVLIKITGGVFNSINVFYMETISIPGGGKATVSCKPFLGLGSIDIVVTVNGVISDYEGKQLVILTQIKS